MSTVILASGTSPAYGVQLTLNDLTGNLSNGDADGVGATMTFNDVASDGGTVLDLIITTVDSYQANNINNNKVIENTDIGQINILNNTGTTFEFQLVEKDTTTPFTVSQLDFGLIDIDKNGKEKVILYTSGDYTVSGSTNLDIDPFADRVEFQANSGSTGEVTNPTDATDATLLSAEQEKHAVNFQFNDISEFYMRYEASSTGGGRNFFFAGDVTFNDTNPVTTSFEVPLEFSPGLGLLLSGGGLISIRCLKKRKQLKS